MEAHLAILKEDTLILCIYSLLVDKSLFVTAEASSI